KSLCKDLIVYMSWGTTMAIDLSPTTKAKIYEDNTLAGCGDARARSIVFT
ncbi:hypothetical protein BgiBS90_008999, partial [Biomphalaria glabrata]